MLLGDGVSSSLRDRGSNWIFSELFRSGRLRIYLTNKCNLRNASYHSPSSDIGLRRRAPGNPERGLEHLTFKTNQLRVFSAKRRQDMRQVALFTIAAGFIVPLMASAPASAQATRTWVSGVGDDVNPCSRTAPCKTFAGAISKTAAGGEINCLDPGGFGAVSPNKSMTISCEAGTAGVLVAGGNGINFNGAAADVLYLKGLDFEGLNKTTGGVGVIGISFNSGAALHVEDCSIRNFSTFGIAIKPSTSATFSVTRTTMFDNTSGGLQLRPTGGFTSGAIANSVISKNGSGISLDGFGGTTGTALTVARTTITGNPGNGILATSTIVANVMVQDSEVSNNGTALTAANGANIRIGSSSIGGNGAVFSGANVLSYGNNQINGNGVDTPPALVPGGLH
jgi:hypothetical protein